MTDDVIHPNGEASTFYTNDGAATVTIPIRLRRRSGRRTMLAASVGHAGVAPDLTAMQQALARGFRWRDMLDTGEVASMKEIAARENTDHSYVARMINMTLLAPQIVEAILDDTLPDIRLTRLVVSPPLLWRDQLQRVGLQAR
ncbi:LacI family transcriptional regulator [Lysobacter sp. Hz 25]|uniref:LacI family transcriptional regulator n=1 Tax=Lysobacter sp. Hz 25 TaxID=3383698 RepID=UPI0038D39DE4